MDSTKRPKVLYVLGGPGSGKGTQCEQFIKAFKFKHLSAGELLREEIKRGTPLGEEINGYVTQGLLVPGETAVNLLKSAMRERGWEKHVFIIDGYPRNFDNIECWQAIMKDDVDVVGALYLSCTEETMQARIMKRGLTSGRSDDNAEAFKTRIKVYLTETQPVIDHFGKIGKLFEVSANGSVEECFVEAKRVIEDLGLDKIEELNDLKEYMHDNIDPYLKPLITYLMKTKPTKVLASIKHWADTEGEEIRKRTEKEA